MRRGVITRRRLIAAGAGLAVASPGNAAQRHQFIQSSDGRKVQVFIWEPRGVRRGVIVFSHGAMSSPLKYQRLMMPWSAAGYRILAPLHVDSADYPDRAHYSPAQSWPARLLDMRAVADFAGNKTLIAAGHSYGGLVALTMAGASPAPPQGVRLPLRDRRVGSAVAFSPPGPIPGFLGAAAYATIATPALIETGTKDIFVGLKGAPRDWRVHLAAYDAAPPGDKYAMVLDGVDHYFGGLICATDAVNSPEPGPLQKAITVSTDFLQAFGSGDPVARARLNGQLGRGVTMSLTRK